MRGLGKRRAQLAIEGRDGTRGVDVDGDACGKESDRAPAQGAAPEARPQECGHAQNEGCVGRTRQRLHGFAAITKGLPNRSDEFERARHKLQRTVSQTERREDGSEARSWRHQKREDWFGDQIGGERIDRKPLKMIDGEGIGREASHQ